MQTSLKDGLYQVKTSFFVAGFTVRDGKVETCAPILKKRLQYWMAQAKLISSHLAKDPD